MTFTETRARTGIELRASEDGDGYTLRGYASTWQPYEVSDFLGTYTETIRQGAFSKTLKDGADVRLLLNHEGVALARTKSGTLSLSQDDNGLLAEARLDPASPLVQTIKSAMDRGDMDQMSFAFSAVRQEWDADYTTRDVIEARLFDVSVVTYPANPTTSVGLRSAAMARFGTRQWATILQQVRAGTLDDASRDILLQVIGALDSAAASVDAATEALEAVAGVVEPDDTEATDMCDGGCGCPADSCACMQCAANGSSTTPIQVNAAEWPAEYRWFKHQLSA